MNRVQILAALRRLSLLGLGLALVLAAARCAKGPEGGKPVRPVKQKVFVIGFDGMDPTLVRKYMAEGKLPNLQKLGEEGVFSKLETTQPSESPVAWSSFATGFLGMQLADQSRNTLCDIVARLAISSISSMASQTTHNGAESCTVPA
jgi:hypothetical protein